MRWAVKVCISRRGMNDYRGQQSQNSGGQRAPAENPNVSHVVGGILFDIHLFGHFKFDSWSLFPQKISAFEAESLDWFEIWSFCDSCAESLNLMGQRRWVTGLMWQNPHTYWTTVVQLLLQYCNFRKAQGISTKKTWKTLEKLFRGNIWIFARKVSMKFHNFY